jgi:hypothetical protein
LKRIAAAIRPGQTEIENHSVKSYMRCFRKYFF